jgi:LacI family transcriptional regulator, kdg operon repressor
MKRITIEDVAKKADVSKSTVSQFINHRYEYMSKETKLRIQATIDELGYRPNYVAKSLKQKQTSTIGVIVANILHAFSTRVIRAVEDVCRASQFHAIVCNADDHPEKEKEYIEMLRAKQVDGLIVFPTGENIDLYQNMVKERYPIVFVDRMVKDVSIDAILLDNEMAIELAVDHLIEKGYKRIGIMTTSLKKNITPRIERVHGYKKALLKHGLPVNKQYWAGVEIDQMQKRLQDMFDRQEPPEAIIAGNDLTLIEILRFAKNTKRQIPNQIAFVGMDEVSFSEVYTPSLTTIAQPAFEMGTKAAKLLLQQIKGEYVNTGKVYRFLPQMYCREST